METINTEKSLVDVVGMLGRMTLSAKIELTHFPLLSARDPNYKNDIQFFLQQFENLRVNVIPIDKFRSQSDSFSKECNFHFTRLSSDYLLCQLHIFSSIVCDCIKTSVFPNYIQFQFVQQCDYI